MLITWAGKETAEFVRQSTDYAALCRSAGNPVETLNFPDHNHFSLAREYTNAESDLVRGVLKLVEAT